MGTNHKHLLILLVLISIGFTACEVHSKADFELVMDENIPGKLHIINRTENAKNLQWYMEVSDYEDGYYTNGEYGSYGYLNEDVTQMYIRENCWVRITLEAVGFTSSTHTETIHVNNVPTRVAIGDVVITKVKLTDELGYEWDDADGTVNGATYTVNSEFPDLVINNQPTANSFSASNTIWDVDIVNGLPVLLDCEHAVFDNLNAYSVDADYFLELIDFDGQQGSTWGGPGKRIGVLNLDLYQLTHKGGGGSDDNYPSVYKIVKDGFEADLYMTWD